LTTKNIEFKVSLNQQEANKQIADLQQRLQGMQKTGQYADRAKSVFGDGTTMSKEAQKIFQSQQSEDLKYLREKFNNLQKLKQNQDKSFQDNQKSLQNEKLLEADKLRIMKEQAQIKERMTSIQREQVDIAERAKSVDPSLQGFRGAGVNPGRPGKGPGNEADYEYGEKGKLDFSGVQSRDQNQLVKQIIGAIGIQRISSLIASGIQGSANFAASTFFEYGQNISRQQAGTIGQMGRASGIDALTSGRGIELPYYALERASALQQARDSLSGLSLRGGAGLLASTVAGAGTGAATGLGVGAAAGAIGGPLAALTAAGGAAAGGIIGGVAGFGSSLFSGQTGAGISSFMNGDGYGAGVSGYRASFLADNFEKNMQAEQEKNYFKTKSLNYLESNRGSFIGAQQMSGMGDGQLFNYLGEAGGLYTTADKLGAMGGIASAGGSTAQMRNGTQALDLKRGYGIQSAAGILGELSGNISGGKGGADEATKKILADAFSVGLDSSNFSRETEKFVQMSAEFIKDSGARTPESMAAVAAEMSSFVAGNSMQELGGAGFGREYLENKLGAGGNQYQKALQMSKSRRDLPGLTESQRMSLSNMSPDQIKAGGMELESMAMTSGMSVEEFQKKAIGVKDFAITPTAGMEERRQSVKTLGQSLGVNPYNLDEINKKLAETKDPAVKAQLMQLKQEAGMLMSEQTSYDSSLGGQSDANKRGLMSGINTFGDTRGAQVPMPGRAETGMEQGEKAQARSEQIMLQKAAENFDHYVDSATKASKATMEMTEAFENFVNAVTTKSKDLEGFAQKLIDTGSIGAPVMPSRSGR
jgi:hypothetical protein